MSSSWLRNCKQSLERRRALYQALRRKSGARRGAARPRLEVLEARCLLSAYTVTSAADDGSAGTLRDAINQANAAGSTITEIDFNIGAVGSARTIVLQSALPGLAANGVFINGLSQGGSGNTKQLIELNGSSAGSDGVSGLSLDGSNCTVSGLIIEDFHTYGVVVRESNNTIGGTASGAGNVISGNGFSGVFIEDNGSGVSGVQIQGNYIGTDVTGTQPLPNGSGIVVEGYNNTIGGTATGAGNLISGNSAGGVVIGGSRQQVEGNYIGTDVTGTIALGNGGNASVQGDGIDVLYSSNNTIGGTKSAARNIISGNHGDGVYIGPDVSGVAVQGNYIGTDVTGTKALADDDGGIVVNGSNDTIGGTASGARNIISDSRFVGVFINDGRGSSASGVQVQGNYIGTDATGTKALGNGIGVQVDSSNNTIGGAVSGAGNIISGNNYGIYSLAASGVAVQGNYIGTDVTGAKAVPNSLGIYVEGSNNTIGGSVGSAGNLIADNSQGGVDVNIATGDTIRLNSIFANGSTGTGPGITLDGGNNNLAAPSLDSATVASNTLTVTGSFTSPSANTNYVLDFFANLSNDAEGKVYLGSLTVTSTNTTLQSFTFTTTTAKKGPYSFITATLTDSSGDTSAFSNGLTIPVTQYVVTSTADDGSFGSLRDAINQANAPGSTITDIDFNIGAVGSAQTIDLTSQLPTLTAIGVFINGLSQGGSGNTKQLITLDGSNAGTSSDGLLLQGSSCIVSGLLLEHFNEGIEVAGSTNTIGGTASGAGNILSGNTTDGVLIDSGASGVTLLGNYIGTDATGTKALANGSNGIEVDGSDNTIGGTTSAARNIISGNTSDGVYINSSASGVQVQGNYIGTDVTGANAVANGIGVEVAGFNDTIGGTVSGARNIISGNVSGIGSDGVLLDSSASSVAVQGNYIGTDATGTKAVANSIGVAIDGSNNTIGGGLASAGNLIAYNGTGAVQVNAGTGDTIRLNSTFANGSTGTGPGITLSNGGNNNLAAPSLDSATVASDTLTVTGSFTSPAANTAYVLDFFANPSNDAEGKVYLGSLMVTSTNATLQSFTFNTPTSATGTYTLITATLTDSSGDTSPFSNGLASPVTHYVVTSTADDGSAGTLRDAINQANAAGSTITEIDFNIGASGSAQTIDLASQLPILTANGVYINGLSQGGSGNATQLITLDGTNAGTSSDGLLLQGSSCIVSGMLLEHFDNGIEVAGSTNTIGGTTSGAGNIISGNSSDGVLIDSGVSGVQVQGNYIGTDATGVNAVANSIGVYVNGSNNTVGGTAAGAGNVISGNNSDGLYLGASGVTVQGNYIGTDVTGKFTVANNDGVDVGVSGNTIGGTATGAGNVVSGNTNDGVLIDSGVSSVLVQGNYIGTDATGTTAVGNISLVSQSYGIYVEGPNNTIGGTSAAARNIISGDDFGVHIDTSASGVLVQGNYIGMDVSGLNYVENVGGVEAEGSNNTIGGTATGARNIISGNETGWGLSIGSAASGVLVQGNYFDGSRYGIIDGGSYDTIGGTSAAARNIISDNINIGVLIGGSDESLQGNYIGTDVTGTIAEGNGTGVLVDGSNNTIGGSVASAGNLIANNLTGAVQVNAGTGDTIRLNSITANYSNDSDIEPGITLSNGGNNNLAAPTLGSATLANNTLTVTGSFYSPSANNTYVLDFYANPSNDAEGKVYLGSLTVTSTNTPLQWFTFTTTTTVTATYPFITATLTDSSGDTSAFATGVMDPTTSYAVTSTADDGSAGTLRDAINQANAAGSAITEIDFHLGSSGSAQTINLTSQLPTLTASGVYINGLSQGANGNTRQLITLNGSGAGDSDGLLLQGSNCSVSGLILENFGKNGIEVEGTNDSIGGSVASAGNVISGNSQDGVLLDSTAIGTLIQGNYIGLNAGGKAALANGSNGLEVQSSNNTIGGNSGSNYYTRNFISGNGNDGMMMDSGAIGNVVQGNFIGLNVSGTQGVGNVGNGVEVAGSGNTIGGTTSGLTNYISDNSNDGVLLDSTATNDLVAGNDVGTDYTGRNDVGNSGSGIEVEGDGNTLGGSVLGAGNIISGNSGDGVLLDSSASGTLLDGNTIGVNATGTTGTNDDYGVSIAGTNNTIGGSAYRASNAISGNTKAGVLLASSASGNLLLGNLIGVNAVGNAVANSVGVEVAGTDNTIGGVASGSRNIISGNSHDGVLLDSTASGNVVLGNYVGTNLYGTAALGNGSNGIEIAGNGNTLGSTDAAANNVISGNHNDGVLLDSGASSNQVLGNFIGTDFTGTMTLANKVGIEDAGNNNTLGGSVLGARNIVSGNSGDGVLLDTPASGETVQGNFMGLNKEGTAALANGSNGIEIQGTNNTIGGNSGSSYFTRNFLTGNGNDGVLIDSDGSGNQVLGNFIGVDISGTHGAGNVGNGVEIAGSSNTVGGTVSGLGNTISGNTGDGVLLDSTASANLLAGNDIGTDYSGRNAVGNSSNGIEVSGVNNTLGGTTAGAGNVIAANSNNGVQIDSGVSGTLVQGNYIGTNAAGGSLGNGSNGVSITGNNNTIGGNAYRAANTIANNSGDGVLVNGGTGNSLLRNSIVGDSGLGISLTNGGNNNVAAPSITSASYSGGTLTLGVSFDAPLANVSYAIELFASPNSDEGAVYLGTVTLTPKSTGTQSFTYKTATAVVGSNPIITATITDSSGDTSEFSNSVTS